MEDLIKALTILSKYIDASNRWPTYCAHDEFNVSVSPQEVSQQDIEALDSLGFFPNEEYDCFTSYRFGSC